MHELHLDFLQIFNKSSTLWQGSGVQGRLSYAGDVAGECPDCKQVISETRLSGSYIHYYRIL